MKRITVTAAAVLILVGLVAAPASAVVKHFQGHVNGGGTVAFDVLFKRGKPKVAGQFEFRNVPVSCLGGDDTANYSTEHSVRVTKKRKFHRRIELGDPGFWAIRGTIRKSGERSSGTTTFNVAGCTTDGPRRWRASRQPSPPQPGSGPGSPVDRPSPYPTSGPLRPLP
jgi:hypothetical protein